MIDQELTAYLAEGDSPLQCPKCGNRTDWKILFSKIYATVHPDGTVTTSGAKPITKPDDIVWICAKTDADGMECNTVVDEGSW